jgi:hypothetical protein
MFHIFCYLFSDLLYAIYFKFYVLILLMNSSIHNNVKLSFKNIRYRKQLFYLPSLYRIKKISLHTRLVLNLNLDVFD